MANRMSKQLHPDLAEAHKAHNDKAAQTGREGWSEDNNGDLDDCGHTFPHQQGGVRMG